MINFKIQICKHLKIQKQKIIKDSFHVLLRINKSIHVSLNNIHNAQ